VCTDVLVIPLYHTSTASCGSVGDCIRKIGKYCDNWHLHCVIIGKTNSPDPVTRMAEFKTACHTTFKEVKELGIPACVVVNTNNSDDAERNVWQEIMKKYLQDNAELCYVEFVTTSNDADSMARRVANKKGANAQVEKMQRSQQSSLAPTPRIPMNTMRDHGKVRFTEGSIGNLKGLIDTFSTKCTDKSRATYVDKWPEPAPKTPISWDDEDDDTANVGTKAHVMEIVTQTLAALQTAGYFSSTSTYGTYSRE